MKHEKARALLEAFPVSPGAEIPPEMVRAMESLKGDAELEADFLRQRAFDHAAIEVLVRPDLPEGVHEQLAEIAEESVRHPATGEKSPARLLAMIGVGASFLSVLALVAWLMLGGGKFAGTDEVVDVANLSNGASKEQYEAVDLRVRELGDWVAMKGIDGFHVPPKFAEFDVVGVRIIREKGAQIVEMLIPENRMFFYVFPAAPLGVDLGSPGKWRFLEIDRRVAALQEKNGTTFMIVFEGTKEDAEKLVADAP